jgi:lipoprotein signal peptidase
VTSEQRRSHKSGSRRFLVTTRTRSAGLIVVVVAVDLLTKLLAFVFLPMDEPVVADAALQIVLRLNPLGMGSWFQNLDWAGQPGQGLGAAIGVTGSTVAVLVIRRMPWRLSRKLVACLTTVVVMSWIAPPVAGVVASLDPRLVEPRATLVLIRASQSALWLTVWMIAPASLWQYCFALLASAALGNFGSLLYPPFHVVDFLYSSIMHEVIGFGVFNVADVAYLVALTLPAVAALNWLSRRAFATTRA